MSEEEAKHVGEPSMLKWVRETHGLDIEIMARAVGVTADEATAWEAGEAAPTIAQARTWARVCGKALAVLYLPSPPPPRRDEMTPCGVIKAALGELENNECLPVGTLESLVRAYVDLAERVEMLEGQA